MKKQRSYTKLSLHSRGSVLAVILVVMMIMSLIGMSVVKVAEGHSVQTVAYQNELLAMSTAEAAYENAIYWMSDNPDLLMEMDLAGTYGSLDFENADADYEVRFSGFVGYRPIFEITANGYCGTFHRSIRVYTTQAISGWEMGQCRVPSGTSSTDEVYFADDEIIDMPIHINSYGPRDDSNRDIHISGDPVFMEEVSMEEQRHSSRGSDKYRDVMDVFNNGISFGQPKSLITDENSIDKKIQWYNKTVTDNMPEMKFAPEAEDSVPEDQPAVQLEFFIDTNGKGSVRITDDCTVRGYTSGGSGTWDYKVKPGSGGSRFETYPIYAFHYIPEDAVSSGKRFIRALDSIQVSAEYGVVDAPPCGMMFVDGNVVIGSASENISDADIATLNLVQGKVAVIATGNIWIASPLIISDYDDAGNYYPRQGDGMPASDNPNGVALFAQGVIKVMDPGLVEEFTETTPGHWEETEGHWETVPGHWEETEGSWEWYRKGWRWRQRWVPGETVWVEEESVWVPGDRVWVPAAENVPDVPGLVYEPVANKDSGYPDGDFHRNLPDPMTIEAAMTVGGGGWGAENVRSSNGRKTSGSQDDLIVRGSLTEVIRGVVGIIGRNGYNKNYYFDERMLSGLIPSTVRLKGKFITVPGGWSDYRVDTKPQE